MTLPNPSLIPLAVIGGSAGSLEAIFQIVSCLPAQRRFALIIVLHRKYDADSSLEILLQSKTGWQVSEAAEKQAVQAGWVYLCPPDYHLLLEQDGTLSLDASEKVNFSRPSIDVTFESAAALYSASLWCILLSGANNDGVAGLQYAAARGARILVQAPAEAPMPYMPLQAIAALDGKATVMHAAEIAQALRGFGQ